MHQAYVVCGCLGGHHDGVHSTKVQWKELAAQKNPLCRGR